MSERLPLPTATVDLIRALHQACGTVLAAVDVIKLEEPITLESLCPPVLITKQTLLDSLKLPTKHAVNAFERHGFYTVGSILKLSRAEALSIPRVGEQCLDELMAVIQPHGFRLRGVPRSKH